MSPWDATVWLSQVCDCSLPLGSSLTTKWSFSTTVLPSWHQTGLESLKFLPSCRERILLPSFCCLDPLTFSISIPGFVVLGGGTKIADPDANFRDPFAGTTSNGFNLANALVNALVNITFSYQGYENAFNVMGEVKNPIRTIKRSAPLSLCLVAVLYILCNVAYFAASE